VNTGLGAGGGRSSAALAATPVAINAEIINATRAVTFCMIAFPESRFAVVDI
jgi:hypothetical protein